MDFLGWFILDILLYLPGAFIRWNYLKLSGSKKSFKEILDEGSQFNNGFIGIVFYILLALLIKWCVAYFGESS